MLYKKYHRNFARRFKKGTRFFIGDHSCSGKIIKPCYINQSLTSENAIYISDNRWDWIVVFPGGKINKYLYVI